MAVTEASKRYHEKMFPDYKSKFLETDPEFIECFDNFAFDEVVNQDDLDGRTRFMAILATLLGCQGTDEFRAMLPAALRFDVTPVEIKEIIYQATAYLGMGRVLPFLKIANDVFEEKGIELPLPSQATTTTENRRKPERRRRWISLVRECGTSGSPARRRAVTSICGWRITVLAITIPAPVWTINSVK